MTTAETMKVMPQLLDRMIGALMNVRHNGSELSSQEVIDQAFHPTAGKIRFSVMVNCDQELSSFEVAESNLSASEVSVIETGIHLWLTEGLTCKEAVDWMIHELHEV